MKRFLCLMTITVFVCSLARAQRAHLSTDQLDSFNWGIIGMIKFNQVSSTEIYPVYSEDVRRFAGKPFDLEGYMIPVQAGRHQTRFLLSTLPINQCYFCGKNGVPIMLLVNMAKPVTYVFTPVKVKGTLLLENKNAAQYMPVSLENAVLMP